MSKLQDQKLKNLVWNRDGHKCIYCGSIRGLGVSRINKKLWNPFLLSNLAIMCGECRMKNN